MASVSSVDFAAGDAETMSTTSTLSGFSQIEIDADENLTRDRSTTSFEADGLRDSAKLVQSIVSVAEKPIEELRDNGCSNATNDHQSTNLILPLAKTRDITTTLVSSLQREHRTGESDEWPALLSPTSVDVKVNKVSDRDVPVDAYVRLNDLNQAQGHTHDGELVIVADPAIEELQIKSGCSSEPLVLEAVQGAKDTEMHAPLLSALLWPNAHSLSLFEDNTFKIEVGKDTDKTTFQVHGTIYMTLLRHIFPQHDEMYQSCLSGTPPYFPQIAPEAFDYVLKCLYAWEIGVTDYSYTHPPFSKLRSRVYVVALVFDLSILQSTFCDMLAQEECVVDFIRSAIDIYAQGCAGRYWRGLSSESFRDFFKDTLDEYLNQRNIDDHKSCAECSNPGTLQKLLAASSDDKDFVADVMEVMLRREFQRHEPEVYEEDLASTTYDSVELQQEPPSDQMRDEPLLAAFRTLGLAEEQVEDHDIDDLVRSFGKLVTANPGEQSGYVVALRSIATYEPELGFLVEFLDRYIECGTEMHVELKAYHSLGLYKFKFERLGVGSVQGKFVEKSDEQEHDAETALTLLVVAHFEDHKELKTLAQQYYHGVAPEFGDTARAYHKLGMVHTIWEYSAVEILTKFDETYSTTRNIERCHAAIDHLRRIAEAGEYEDEGSRLLSNYALVYEQNLADGFSYSVACGILDIRSWERYDEYAVVSEFMRKAKLSAIDEVECVKALRAVALEWKKPTLLAYVAMYDRVWPENQDQADASDVERSSRSRCAICGFPDCTDMEHIQNGSVATKDVDVK